MKRAVTVVGTLSTLFQGRNPGHGFYNLDTKESKTSPKLVEHKHYWRHLKPGSRWSLGRHPQMTDGRCWFGALDWDRIDLTDGEAQAVAKVSLEARLPLVWCLSKSRGLHGFLFLTEPMAVDLVQRNLFRWGTEVFGWAPKQTGDSKAAGDQFFEIFPKLQKRGGGEFPGGWINLPYAGGADSPRYAVSSRGRESLAWFLNVAVHRRVSALPDAPAIPPGAFDGSAEGVALGSRPLTGAMLEYPEGRNNTLFRCLCSAREHGWSDDAITALAEAQFPSIPQGEAEFPLEEMRGLLERALKYEPGAPLWAGTTEDYRRALLELHRIGWSDDAMRACRAAEVEEINRRQAAAKAAESPESQAALLTAIRGAA